MSKKIKTQAEEMSEDCQEMIRRLLYRYSFLRPGHPRFDVWDSADAREVVADLIIMLHASDALQVAEKDEFGE